MVIEDEMSKNQRFLSETEQIIRLTNNQVIHERMAPINTERMVSFSVVVAKLRSNYIEAAFKFADTNNTVQGREAHLEELSLCRREFVEARDAFIALQRAIELGYVNVE